MHELHSELVQVDCKGATKSFITYLMSIPRIIVHLLPHNLLQSLEMLLKVESSPVTLHYDTVFNVGDFYLSTLTYRHSIFESEPIIPCGFLLHTRRLQVDHQFFLEAITKEVSQLLMKRVNIVSDREFNFADIFSCGTHLYCWNHYVRDIQWHLKGPCNCSSEDINFFSNTFRTLMISNTEDEFDAQWLILRQDDHFVKKAKVLSYFESNIIPSFKQHAAVWTLRAARVKNPSNGITNNPSESFNAVLHRLQKWKQVPLDVITVSLFYLSSYYQRESVRSLHQCGRWQLKDEFDFLRREPSMMPRLPPTWDPKDIVDKVSTSDSVTRAQLAEATTNTSQSVTSEKSTTHLGLANDAITSNRVKAVGDGAWVVLEADGVTPRAVRLFPKETCSCVSTRTCFHITACKIMVGLPPTFKGTINATEVNRRKRRTVDKHPAGRKKPRKNDFDGISSQPHGKNSCTEVDAQYLVHRVR